MTRRPHLFSIYPRDTNFFSVARIVETAGQRDTADRDVGSRLYHTRLRSNMSLHAVSMIGAAAGIAAPVAPLPVVQPPVVTPPVVQAAAAGAKRDAVHRTPPRPVSKR